MSYMILTDPKRDLLERLVNTWLKLEGWDVKIIDGPFINPNNEYCQCVIAKRIVDKTKT